MTEQTEHHEPLTTISRMYYRNKFFHIGHLKTLYDNDRLARNRNGVCYAIIDDRQDSSRIASIQEDFDYLQLKHIKTVSVKSEQQRILQYTLSLIRDGHVYLYHCEEKITNIDKIIKAVTQPKMHFQLRINCGMDINDPAIGYTNEENGNFTMVMIFDYIIKVLDILLGVTDIVTTSHTDINGVKDIHISSFFDKLTKIRQSRLSTYHIHNFRYSKRGWEVDENNPYLLTIKGLKARSVPVSVLKAFYLHGCQMGSIKIQFIATLLNKYMFKNSEKALGVLKPLKIHIDNWRSKQTEYVCGPKSLHFSKETKHYPLSDVIYIDTSDYGIEPGKINKGRTVQLSYGPCITCTDINLVNPQQPVLTANIDFQATSPRVDIKKIHWISSVWDDAPCQARFYLYNWFYTGFNTLIEPEIVDGYIDNSVFSNLDQIYQLEQLGYFVYDRTLSEKHNMPIFLRICKI